VTDDAAATLATKDADDVINEDADEAEADKAAVASEAGEQEGELV
jgi:hypothetical protein